MSSSMRGAGGARLVAGIVALGLSLAFGGAAQAAPQYAMDCTSCHTMPPADSGTAKKDPFTGAVPGNHLGHASSAASSCVVCHGSAVTNPGYTNSHRNKVIELSDGLGYTRKVNGFLNQTSVPPNPLGTCSTAACHSDGKGNVVATPAWGRTAFEYPADCSQCHAVAPSTGTHPTVGTKHAAYFGTGTGSCDRCHTSHTTFSHATSAGKRGIEVKFAAGGSFNGTKCSNVYCHSNGKGTFTDVNWSGATLDCAGCHGTATTSGGSALSGKHAKHVNNAAFLGTNFGCVECHSDTVSNNSTIANTAKHTNGGPIDVIGANAGSFVAASGSCATSYCHTDGKGTQKTVTWTQSQTLDCKGCHGSDTASGFFTGVAGEPNYKNDGEGQPRANSHKNHVTGAADCQNCHAATTVDGVSIKTGAAHISHNAELTAGNGKSFTAVGDTCSNVSCHSGGGIVANVGAARWGKSLGCSGCHGDSGTTNPLITNAHGKHISGMGYACSTCHVNTVASGSTVITNSALHGNSYRDVGGSFTYTEADKSCATTCHRTATPKWNITSSGACGTCHKALSDKPNGLIDSGSHSVHFSAKGPNLSSTDGNACATCHIYTGETGINHANGNPSIKLGYSTNGTCVDCHKQTTVWGASVSCESCHSRDGGELSVINGKTAPDKTAAAHSGHGSLGANAQACSACHDGSSAHIGVPGGTSRTIGNVSGTAACSVCHNGSTAQTQQLHVGFANSCQACHDPHGTGNAKMVLKNFSTVTNVAFGGTNFVNAQGTGVCQACHTATAYFKRNVAETQHPDSDCLSCHAHSTASGTAFEPNRQCDSCHGYPPAPRVTNSAVVFGVQGHWSSARFEDYSGGGGAHVVAAHIPEGAKPADGWVNCIPCHKGGATTHNKAMPMRNHVENVTVKLDPQFRFSDDAFMAYTSAKLVSGGANETGKCFNVSCHFRTTKKWSIER